MILVDTSALYSLIDKDDLHHLMAKACWGELARQRGQLAVHRFIVVEAATLLQRRIGMAPVRFLLQDVLASLSIVDIAPLVFDKAMTAFLAADKRRVSLVDQISFAMLQSLRATKVFAFDDDFQWAGFEVVPVA